MSLVQLDHVVFHDHLLPLLKINDLLRLRRVCHHIRIITEDYIRINKIKSSRELVSNFYEYESGYEKTEENTQVTNQFTTGLPIRYRVRLSSNDTEQETSLYTDSALKFCQNLGIHLTHLTMANLGIPFGSKKIAEFFEQFPNLRHLLLEEVRPWMRWGQDTELDMDSEIEIPSNLKKLESLSITNCCIWGTPESKEKSFGFIVKLVESCLKSLISLSLPFDQFLWNIDTEKVMKLACLCIFCENAKLKISSVDGNFIEELLNPDNRLPEMGTLAQMAISINEKVVSVKNPKLKSFLLELPKLEKIHFESTSEQCIMPEYNEMCTKWLNLEEIIVCADFEHGHRRNPLGPELPQVWDFLFGSLGDNIFWEKLVKLDISLCGFVGNVETYPSTYSIVGSCSNLKSIVIRYWARRHGELAVLWGGLPGLEEVRFDHCTGLGDEAFFGAFGEGPAFLKLKNLKTLELGSIEVMNITDVLFSEILCHMSLKELVLSSDDLIDKDDVVKWLQGLLSGQFKESIERFCLDDLEVIWGGEQGEQEFNKLKLQFRSFSMV